MMKKARKEKAVKTAEARAAEALLIESQLSSFGFPADEVLDAPRAALRAFAADGVGSTTMQRLPALGVSVMLLLSTQPHVTSYARVSKLK